MWRSATSDSANGSSVQATASTTSSTVSRASGSASGISSHGASGASSGARASSATAPAPSSTAVIASGSACSTKRLLSDPNTATRIAEITPTAMPARMSPGTPPTTSATPGSTAMPIARSPRENGRRAIQGSTIAVNTVASAMQVAATEALASLIEP